MEAALFRQPRFFPAEYTLSWQAGNAASSGSLKTSVHVRVAPCATLGTPDALEDETSSLCETWLLGQP